MKKYILSDPEILGGMPVVKGTRVPIARIIYLLSEGKTLQDIQEHFPHITLKTLEKVLDEVAGSLDTTQHAPKTL